MRNRHVTAGSTSSDRYSPASATVLGAAIVLGQMGDTAAAQRASEEAIKAGGETAPALWNMALMLERSGKLEEAEKSLKQVLNKVPKEEEARFDWGICDCSGRITAARSRFSMGV